jgi:hypothetical protein
LGNAALSRFVFGQSVLDLRINCGHRFSVLAELARLGGYSRRPWAERQYALGLASFLLPMT